MDTKNMRVERLSRSMMRRSVRLLDMEYKPSEIADELGVTKEQVIRLISAGAPVRKDDKGHYWIHGEKFSLWLYEVAPKKQGDKSTLPIDECYCFGCRSIVKYTEHRRKSNFIFGTCPKGHKVTRIVPKNMTDKNTTGKARKRK